MIEALAPKSQAKTSRRARNALAYSLALVAAVVSSAPAHADECAAATYSGCINADNLWPHAGPGPFLTIGSPTTTPDGKAAIGLVGSYLSRPVGIRVASPDPDGTIVPVLDNVVDVTFVGAFGVTDRLEFTVAAPVTLYQDGSGLGLPWVDERCPGTLRLSVRQILTVFFATHTGILSSMRSTGPLGPASVRMQCSSTTYTSSV